MLPATVALPEGELLGHPKFALVRYFNYCCAGSTMLRLGRLPGHSHRWTSCSDTNAHAQAQVPLAKLQPVLLIVLRERQ